MGRKSPYSCPIVPSGGNENIDEDALVGDQEHGKEASNTNRFYEGV